MSDPLRIVVTGSRHFVCSEVEFDEIMLRAIRQVVAIRNPYDRNVVGNVTVLLGEGGADGADLCAREWAMRRGTELVDLRTYSADWSAYGLKAGPMRNARMLKEHQPELVLAIWDGSVARSGTHNCMTQAAKLGIAILVHPIPG